MKISIACVSDVADSVRPFLLDFKIHAEVLGAEFILGVHGDRALQFACEHKIRFVRVEGQYFEELIDPVIEACTGDYVLRVDDDERLSTGMLAWLLSGDWWRRDSWFFSRRHLWPNERYCLAKQPYFPDFQARLSVRRQARRPVKIHAAHAYPAYRAPALAFLDHHVFLIRTREERKAVTAKYETIRTGKICGLDEVNVVMPYDDPNPTVLPVTDEALLQIAEDTVWWREMGQRLPANLEQELREFRESLAVR